MRSGRVVRSRKQWEQSEGHARRKADRSWTRPVEAPRGVRTQSHHQSQHPKNPASVAERSTCAGPSYLGLVIVSGIRHGCGLTNTAGENEKCGRRLRREAGSSAPPRARREAGSL